MFQGFIDTGQYGSVDRFNRDRVGLRNRESDTFRKPGATTATADHPDVDCSSCKGCWGAASFEIVSPCLYSPGNLSNPSER